MKHPRSSNPRRRRQPFTLVEMLAVIAIMMILFGIAVAPFGKLLGGSGVDGAARMIGAQLRLARQYALSQRKYIAVLMPNETGLGLDDYCYTGFRSCVVESDGTGYDFVEWIPDSKWEVLPKGAVVAEIDSDYHDENGPDNAKEMYGDPKQVNPNWDPSTEGTHEEVDKVDEVAGQTSRAIVFKPTGKSTSRYITVVEAAVSNGSLISETLKRNNMIILETDQYTGRVAYHHVGEDGS